MKASQHIPHHLRILLLLMTAYLIAACSTPPAAPTAVLPTLVPTVAVVTPTTPSLPTATPPPAAVTILAPQSGLSIDLGDTVDLQVLVSDPVGVRLLSLTSNGQGIGTHRGVEQKEMAITQQWRPEYAGTHRIVALATSRTGESLATDPVILKVVDREMLSRNGPIWAKVEGNVTALRGLAPLEPIEPTLMTRSELRRYLEAEIHYTEADARRDVLVMHTFDFLPLSFDLYYQSRRYLGESIAGFYDPETKEFVVVSDDKKVDALEQWTHAHEFMHALQDQHFQLDLITDTTLGSEASLALRALAEGEAELLQGLYIENEYFSQAELVEIFNIINRIRTRDVDYLPPVFVNSFLFPYTVGYEFAEAIHTRSGWTGLNDAWQNMPVSTEQIIHPDRYFAGDVPQIVTLAPLTDTLGSGWQMIEEDTLGEFMLREYLDQRLQDDEVEVAATGWGGDRYAVYWQAANDDLVMALRLFWDTQSDSDQFVEMFNRYGIRRHGPDGQRQPDGGTCWQAIAALCLYQDGIETVVVRAPDLEIAGQVAAALRP